MRTTGQDPVGMHEWSTLTLHIVLATSAAIGLTVLDAGCTSLPAQPRGNEICTTATLKDKWGVEITSLRMSGHGHLIDFRYRVLDPGKAAMLGDRRYRPCLIDQATGTKMVVPDTPKLGPLRQSATRLEAGKIYFMLFSNAGLLVKPGSRVTIEIGDFRADNLTVE